MTFADTIVVMSEGEVVQVGTPQELYDHPRSTYVGYFIGSPAMNFLSCTLEGGRLEANGGSIPLPAGVSIPAGARNLKIGIRPRHVQFTDSSCPGAIKGQVQLVQEFGNARVVTVGVREEKLRVKLKAGVAVPTGDVWVTLPEEKLCIYADEVLVGR
jgi:glycerol transport system ATP-binding protein